MPNNPRGGGVSRRVEGEERNELRDADQRPRRAAGHERHRPHRRASAAPRRAAVGHELPPAAVARRGRGRQDAGGAYLIYQESSLVIRAIRDYFHQEIGELLIDTEAIYEQAQQFMSHVMPANVNRVKLYKDDVPLFSRFQIEHQIETATRAGSRCRRAARS
jgi:ribonuclease E